ncbi:MAG: M48 family metalloprotease [Thermodesulfobacteriota bacterium]
MRLHKKSLAASLALLGLAPLLVAWGPLDVLDSIGGVNVGGVNIRGDQIRAVTKTVRAVDKAFTDITPEQEYYIGRAVAATLLGRYRAHPDPQANLYLNTIGQTLARFSDLPETFGGYHFQILDDDSINAFAAPGGLILVSRGLLRCCPDEDAVAAVLAHEIGHIQQRHGLQAIRQSRYTDLFTTVAAEGAKQFAGREVAQLTTIFEGSIHDITATLVNSGYSRAAESEADAAAVRILTQAGYDPGALVSMLTQMKQRLRPEGLDFAKTHPDPADRIAEITPLLGDPPQTNGRQLRQPRFARALATI